MRKIIIAFDGTHLSNGAFELARRLNEHERILVLGLFIPEIDFSQPTFELEGEGKYQPYNAYVEEDKIDDHIRIFENNCRKHGIEYITQKTRLPYHIRELAKECRFADLLILSIQKFYEHLRLGEPNEYLRDLLHDTECPVVVAPDKFDYPAHIILAYDGSRSSVYAIRMFSYIFPDLCTLPTTLVYAAVKKQSEIPDQDYIQELAGRHFSDLTFLLLEGRKTDELHAWLQSIAKPMLVTGAFGRSGLSNLFRKSFSTNFISDYRYPVFIAHN